MRYALALLLLGHGIAHLPGFLVGWQLASFPELPFRTTVLAHTVDVGVVGARLVGAGWMIVSLMFVGTRCGCCTSADRLASGAARGSRTLDTPVSTRLA